MRALDWNDFKNICVTKKHLSLQFEDLGPQYRIIGPDGTLSWEIVLNKLLDDGSANPDVTDFEENYKSDCNNQIIPKTADGLPKYLSAISVDNISLFVKGSTFSITGDSQHCDISFNYVIELQGINVSVKDANEGDYIDFEVGYTGQSGWVSLSKFGETVYTKDGSGWQDYQYRNNSVAKIPAGLTLRLTYTQANSATTKKVILHYITHK